MEDNNLVFFSSIALRQKRKTISHNYVIVHCVYSSASVPALLTSTRKIRDDIHDLQLEIQIKTSS